MNLQDRAIASIREHFPDSLEGEGSHAGQKWVFVRRDSLIRVLGHLRDALKFDLLMDLTAVDLMGLPDDAWGPWNSGRSERFCLVYELHSLGGNEYFRLKSWVPEDSPEVDTASGLWKAANWAEREIWDMYGIRFRGHPDLRRLLMPFEYEGYPLRKDYPLIGRGERQTFPRYVK